ncbi:hypothetical protein SG34_000320 [Thalassomonas viridans]|uniref:Uncharacterized protein n=1 Tax=Thalassomonas viridans TaxID=137584 RepID=A0AAE9Z2M2_9GAMM|nr:hypothetical protein [Thalassomonas viridans]WDE05433.1 hypothetical protein SG34_000320 [Thalassomonas viridans]
MTKNIENYYKSNFLSHFYDCGMSPEEIKESLFDSLSTYFLDKQNFKKYAFSELINTWQMYLSVYKEFPEFLTSLEEILNIFNEAKKANHIATLNAYVEWLPEISHGISRLWSLLNYQHDLSKLSLDDFVEISMDTIGKMIEGVIKNFVFLLIHLNRIKRGKNAIAGDIKNRDLGECIDELINTSNLDSILVITPHNIRLNQWRNIAYHHNIKVIENNIYISYLQKNQREEINLSRTELFLIVKKVVLSFTLMRLSENIFSFNNQDSIHKVLDSSNSNHIKVRNESREVDFIGKLSSQGFKVIDLQTDKEDSLLKVTDMQLYSDYEARAIHASQFLYQLWLYTNSSSLIIEYLTHTGEVYLRSKISSVFFTKVNTNNELVDALENTEFTLSKKRWQTENPFKSLKISKRQKKMHDYFLSQYEEKISLNEFIKQFTLTVFCNYLALRSEGFGENEISLNITDDGVVSIAKGSKGSVILLSQAPIKEPEVKKIVSKSINAIIKSFIKAKLQKDIVDSAIYLNKFYCKKSFIKAQLKPNKN